MKNEPEPVLRCLIIDDETHAHKSLKFHINKVPWLKFVGSCKDGVQALTAIERYNPDIIFLDVDMPHISGLSLIGAAGNIASKVILTTAHGKYAVEGFDLEVADFLLKPISFEKFLRAVNKIRFKVLQARRQLTSESKQTGEQNDNQFHPFQIITREPVQSKIIAHPADSTVYGDKSIWITVRKIVEQIDYVEITFIQSDGNYAQFYAKGRSFLTRVSLIELARNLPSFFVQTHRSYIVNRNAIKSINGNEITMNVNDYKVPISADARNNVFQKLTEKYG